MRKPNLGRKQIDTSEVKGNLNKVILATPIIIDQVLRTLIQEIRKAAKEMVPKDTHHLERSIRYRVSKGVATIYARTSWGDVDESYALYVHEDLEQHHEQGQAKYIEKPLLHIGMSKLAQEIAKAALRRIGSEKGMKDWRVEIEEEA